jgi:hypothetical protein
VLGCEGFVGGRDGFAGAAPVCVDCGEGVVSIARVKGREWWGGRVTNSRL